MTKRKYVWYIEPLDSATNEVLSRELAGFSRKVICEDSKKHNLWDCSWDFVFALKKSKKHLDLKFRVFNRRGMGQIREFKFPYLKKRKRWRDF